MSTIKEAREAFDKAVEFYGDCAKANEQIETMCHAEEIVDEAMDAYGLAVLDALVTRAGFDEASESIVARVATVQAIRAEIVRDNVASDL